MRIIIVITALIMCLSLAGCSAGPMISAESGAVQYGELPSSPPGLVEPETAGFRPDGGSLTCEYAFAPKAAETLSGALSAKNTRDFAEQYAVSFEGEFEVGETSFFEAGGMLITGALKEDTEYSKAGSFAACAVVPYGEYFVIVEASGRDASVKDNVQAFLDAFSIDNAPAGAPAA